MAHRQTATPNMFGDDAMTGAEYTNRLDRLVQTLDAALKEAKALQAASADFHGLDPVQRPKPVNPVSDALKFFDECHRRLVKDPATGEDVPATIAWGKDNAIMKRVIQTHGEDRTRRLIETFFERHDPYIERQGYSVQTFGGQVSRLIAQIGTPMRAINATRNTADNRQAAQQAAAMINGSTNNHGHMR